MIPAKFDYVAPSSLEEALSALSQSGDAKVIAPGKPWFSYVCPGAGHAPHHVFKEWADKYAGRFDMGYERYREIVLEHQK